jgi:hypothetical protein
MDPKYAAALLDAEGEAIPETIGRLFNVWFSQEVETNR